MAKKKRKTAGRKARSSGRRAGGSLTNLSTSDLAAELRRRERTVESLIAKRQNLLAQADSLGDEIAALGGEVSARPVGGRRGRMGRTAAGTSRKRPQNDQNLEEALADLLKDKTMSVTEMAQAVQDAGYRTTSPNFRTIVNQTLLRSDRFKKIARGQYTAK